MLPNVRSVLSKANSVDSTSNNNCTNNANMPGNDDSRSDIVKSGYLKKHKTMKKKFFVLRAGSESGPARLEYYDSEKRMKSNAKRSIVLQACFNINKKLDSKHKLAIALYTKDDCFSIVPETEAELEEWLTWLLALQQGHVTCEGNITTIDKEAKPKPHFEFMWQISVRNKGLASKTVELVGPRRLCLTSTMISLVKLTDKRESLDFPLMGIRRCGHSDCFFFMEVGRSSITGAGEIWMQTEDTVIAQNMHEAILSAMKACRSLEELGPISRPRSASTSENSKPTSARHGAVTSNTSSIMGSSGSITGACGGSSTSVAGSCGTDRSERNSFSSVGANSLIQTTRERCDSMPTRSRCVSEGNHEHGIRQLHFELLRPLSTYGHSPPIMPNPLSPSSGGFSDSAGSSLSIEDFDSPSDFHHNRYLIHPSDGTLHEPTITEENPDDYLSMAPVGTGADMTDSGVGLETKASSSYSDVSMASTIVAAEQLDPPAVSNYLEMIPAVQNTQPNSPPSFLNLTSKSQTTIDNKSVLATDKDVVPSVAPTSESTVTRKESSGYVEMTSPQTSNPPGHNAGYFMMSPGALTEERDSIKKEGGYVQMNPGSNTTNPVLIHPFLEDGLGSTYPDTQYEGYLCMEVNSLSSSLPRSIPHSSNVSDCTEHMSSPRSNHSFHDSSLSCSPAEMELFPLEKVKSYFPPLDEDEDYIKPARAYSIGSRPQIKTHLSSHLEQSRVRAYSFGSHMYSSRIRSRLSDSAGSGQGAFAPVSGIDSELGTTKSLDAQASKKSSSAPLLPNSTAQNSLTNCPNSGSLTPVNKEMAFKSVESRSEDLMEINYQTSNLSKTTHDSRLVTSGSVRSRANSRSNSSALANALNSAKSAKDSIKTNQILSQSSEQKSPSSRVEDEHYVRQQKSIDHELTSSKATSDYWEMSGGKAKPFQAQADYWEMSAGKAKTPHADYWEMTGSKGKPTEAVKIPFPKIGVENATSKNLSDEYVNIDLSKAKSQLSYMETRGKICVKNSTSPPHSYVNCTPEPKASTNSSKRQPQCNEYFLMNFDGNAKGKLSETVPIPDSRSQSTESFKTIPSLGEKCDEKNDYYPVSSCDIPSLSPNVNKKTSIFSDSIKMNGRKSSNSSGNSGKTKIDTSSALNSSSFRGNQQKLDRLVPKDEIHSFAGSKNSSSSSLVSMVTPCGIALVDASYENIQIGPLSSSYPKPGSSSAPMERELNYASLDLAPSIEGDDKVPKLSGSSLQLTTPENVEEASSPSALSYAEIDFTKSEGLRNVSSSLREERV